MPRPRSEDRRNAILSAATRVIAAQGLGAPTAAIAKDAGVSNGLLFVYFDTKAILLNELYVTLKKEMGAVAVAGLPVESNVRERVLHMWNQWLRWATSCPEKRRALAQLQVADDITAARHPAGSSAFSGTADLRERSRASGPRRDGPLGFVLTLTTAIADAATDAIIREPADAEARGSVAFEAMWRGLAGLSLPANA